MTADHATLARRLRDAYTVGPVAPLRDGLDPADVAGAYAVQAMNVAHWVAGGRRPVGWKIGLTSAAIQKQLGVDQPDYGVLFDDMILADGGLLPTDRLFEPRVEAEVAIILAADLDRLDTSRADMAAAVEHVVAAIEIVDSRIAHWAITLSDTVADNASSAFCVLGTTHKPVAGLDLWTCGMALEVNGHVASVGAGAACLGHPLEAAAWLARTAARRGTPLRKGDLILTGALGPMVSVYPGDRVRATIGGLGTVSFECK